MSLAHPLLLGLELEGTTGLEIGALHNPLMSSDEVKVLFVDHASTEELRRKYEGHDVGDLVEVDVVWGDQSLRAGLDAALGDGATVDFVVASHVIEHVPDLIGWLEELTAVLRPGGVIALSIPDKRYCFDVRRRTSDTADVIEARLQRRTRPGLAATFDFWTKHTEVDTQALWAGHAAPPPIPVRDGEALERTMAAATSADYHDVHAWVFTPASLREVLERLIALDLLPGLSLRRLSPTQPGSLEFYVVLERLPEPRTDADRAAQLQSTAAERFGDLDGPVPAPGGEPFVPSPRELRLLRAKRRVVEGLRARIPGRRP